MAVAVADVTAARAEALAKAALIAGPSAGADLLRSTGVRGWLFNNDGSLAEIVEDYDGPNPGRPQIQEETTCLRP